MMSPSLDEDARSKASGLQRHEGDTLLYRMCNIIDVPVGVVMMSHILRRVVSYVLPLLSLTITAERRTPHNVTLGAGMCGVMWANKLFRWLARCNSELGSASRTHDRDMMPINFVQFFEHFERRALAW